MKIHSFLKLFNVKKLLMLLFTLIMFLSLAVLVITLIIDSHSKNIHKNITDSFDKIKVQLEFKGVTEDVKEMSKNYSNLFHGLSNIIITDDTGKILYNVNNGFISEKNKFLVLIDPWQNEQFGSNVAYLIDSKNNIKYSTQLDIFLNINKLKELSSKNTLSKILFSDMDADDYNFASKEIVNDGATYVLSSETDIIMNYDYIASRGLNLYSLYNSEHENNNIYNFTSHLGIFRTVLLILTGVSLILFWTLLPLWVFKDAKIKHLNAPFWTIIIFFTNFIGLGLYLLFRPKNEKCISCNRDIEHQWILCPYCGCKVNRDK